MPLRENTAILKLADLDLKDKYLLIREDLNVPIKNNKVVSDVRIRATIPTIRLALKKGARVMLMSHLGSPTEGKFTTELSLKPVAERLSEILNISVRLVKNYLDGVHFYANEVLLFENVRFNTGERKNDDTLAKKIAALCDVFVMDAFASAHRVHASTYGVVKYAKIACAGPLLIKELDALNKALNNPKRPLVAVVGGAKVSSKLTLLETLSKKVDKLILGGGIANTFIAAKGYEVGKSLYEKNLISVAKKLMVKCDIPIPYDVAVGKAFSEDEPAIIKPISAILPDEIILDIGPNFTKVLAKFIENAGTIVWNGPVGVFELDAFSAGTKTLAHAIANSKAFSIAGGGDTLSAIDTYQIADKISYISTGGGAFLEFLEGKTLPAVQILTQRASEELKAKVKNTN